MPRVVPRRAVDVTSVLMGDPTPQDRLKRAAVTPLLDEHAEKSRAYYAAYHKRKLEERKDEQTHP